MTALEVEIAAYKSANPKSKALHDQATRFMPGGDTRNSIFWSPFPVYVTHAEGTKLTDADGNVRTDFVNNMTTLIMGHRHPDVIKALRDQLDHGVSFPAPSPSVVRWAEIICERVPSVEKVRFVNSGTEATLNAIRAARAFTGKTLIAKCEGAYHGNHDAIQISVTPAVSVAGDAEEPESVVMFPGINPGAAEDIVIMPYNNLPAAERIIRKHSDELAAVIVEPINGQCGMVPAKPEFLQGLREVTAELGIPLIFDEVISFRAARGGAQEFYGIKPDLTCFGKVIGGGMPLAAFGGRRDVMEHLAPLGPVYQAGTLSGNPVATACGLATLREIQKPGFFEALSARTQALVQGLTQAAQDAGVPFCGDSQGGMFGFFLMDTLPQNYATVMTTDGPRFNRFFHGMLDRGVYFAPALYEAGFVSAAHTEADVAETVAAARDVLATL